MNSIDKRIRINELLSIYKEALSPNEKGDLSSYYEEDLSIGEIALNRKVSRNAIYLSLKQGEKELEKLESKLHFLTKKGLLRERLDQLEKAKTEEEKKAAIEKIKEVI